MAAYPEVRFLTSANKLGQAPPDTGAEVAVAGRSNAGKSSAINAITQRKGLAKTSKNPGATRLLFESGGIGKIHHLMGVGAKAGRQGAHLNGNVSGMNVVRLAEVCD